MAYSEKLLDIKALSHKKANVLPLHQPKPK